MTNLEEIILTRDPSLPTLWEAHFCLCILSATLWAIFYSITAIFFLKTWNIRVVLSYVFVSIDTSKTVVA